MPDSRFPKEHQWVSPLSVIHQDIFISFLLIGCMALLHLTMLISEKVRIYWQVLNANTSSFPSVFPWCARPVTSTGWNLQPQKNTFSVISVCFFFPFWWAIDRSLSRCLPVILPRAISCMHYEWTNKLSRWLSPQETYGVTVDIIRLFRETCGYFSECECISAHCVLISTMENLYEKMLLIHPKRLSVLGFQYFS